MVFMRGNIAARKVGRDRLDGRSIAIPRIVFLPCFGYFSPITSNRGGASSYVSHDISDGYQWGEGIEGMVAAGGIIM
jgi:hypothetical protein